MAGTVRSLVDGVPGGTVPVTDRGFAYGDGVFRTVRVERGVPWLLSDHLQTLARDCGRLGIPFRPGLDRVLAAELAQLVPAESGILRIVITRGSGPRGDRPPEDAHPRRALLFFPGAPAERSLAGRSIRLCETRLPRLPALAGVKHLNRLPQVLARAEWAASSLVKAGLEDGPEEGLMQDDDDTVVCGTMTNLFLLSGRALLTPRIDRAGVAGVMRGRIIDGRVALPDGIDRVVEARIDLATLLAASEVFLTNAVIGLWPVRALAAADGTPLASWPAPGPVTQRIFEHPTFLGGG